MEMKRMRYDIHFSFRDIEMILFITLLGVFGSVFAHVPFVVGFAPGLLFLIVLCRRKGVSASDIFSIGMRGLLKTKEVMIILLFVGMLLPMWDLSGTIGEMVALFLQFLSKKHFLLLSFLFMMLTSLLLGTAVGSLSALGIPIMSAASALHLPKEIVAGALISGAFVGDRTSLFSSAHQLLSFTVEVPLYRQFRNLMTTTVIALLFSLCIYFLFDLTFSPGGASSSFPASNTMSWNESSAIALIPPVVLLLLVCCRIKIKYAFLSSTMCAMMLALAKGVSFSAILDRLWNGGEQMGGGVRSMIFLLLFIAMAGFYNGLLEELKIIQPLLDRWLANSRSLVSHTWRTVVATWIISVVACNQTLPIILTGRSFIAHWQKHHSREELARVMADSTMLFPGMVPWSILAIMCSTITDTPVLSYLPYAFFLWSLPLITMAVSFRKQNQARKNQMPSGKNVASAR
jgi:NhaC family Na+:H+ antiporter